MGILIQRLRSGEEIVQAIPREAVVALELLDTRLLVRTQDSVLEVQLRPEQLEEVKSGLLSFLNGKLLWLREEG